MTDTPDTAAESDPPPQPPLWPGDDACCGNGCDPCVFDLFEAERERHRVALREWQARQAAASPGA